MSLNFEGNGTAIAFIYDDNNNLIQEVCADADDETGLNKIRINDNTHFFPAIPDWQDGQSSRLDLCLHRPGAGFSNQELSTRSPLAFLWKTTRAVLSNWRQSFWARLQAD